MVGAGGEGMGGGITIGDTNGADLLRELETMQDDVDSDEDDTGMESRVVVSDQFRFNKFLEAFWNKYDKTKQGKLSHEQMYMVLSETLEALSKECGLSEDQIEGNC